MNDPNAAAGSTYWICTQNPNVPAATDLLNRALDKPVEPVHVTGDGSPIVICWQTGGHEQEAGQVRELPEDVDDKIRRAKKVNGHVEPDGESHD